MNDFTLTAPAAGPVQETIEDNILAALEYLPLGRAEEDVCAAAFYIRRMTDPTEREIAEWQDAFDYALHDMIREGNIAQRVVGGRVRLLMPLFAFVLDDEADR
ncbi:hypothetical protein [Rhodococcus sp. IEGM 1408]|uniref:hypothetical protein n=1 Tax=Rhodococcus sp. IEGM 1408 TaxID=3082220 RepID=UPI002955AB2D|nr:hypothetical protein [Rhodococcus sp. IEGM 1408]MDV8000762.1 hypothetical protein [Rhodococcus sp. IEGM 1408]